MRAARQPPAAGRAHGGRRGLLTVAAVVMALGSLLALANPAAGAPVEASMAIFDDDGGQAMFDALDMAPGRRYAQCVRVGSDSTDGLDVVQLGAADISGDLAGYLHLTVEIGDGGRFGDCTAFDGVQIFSGSLPSWPRPGRATGWPPGGGPPPLPVVRSGSPPSWTTG